MIVSNNYNETTLLQDVEEVMSKLNRQYTILHREYGISNKHTLDILSDYETSKQSMIDFIREVYPYDDKKDILRKVSNLDDRLFSLDREFDYNPITCRSRKETRPVVERVNFDIWLSLGEFSRYPHILDLRNYIDYAADSDKFICNIEEVKKMAKKIQTVETRSKQEERSVTILKEISSLMMEYDKLNDGWLMMRITGVLGVNGSINPDEIERIRNNKK